MRSRRRSPSDRAREAAPGFAIVGLGIAGVFVAMNVLVSSAPFGSGASASPNAAISAPPPPSPSQQSLDTPYPVGSAGPRISLPATGPTIVHSAVSESDPGGIWKVYLLYPAFVQGTTPYADAIDSEVLTELETRAAQWEAGPAAIRQAPGKVNTLYGSFTTEMLTAALGSFTLSWVDDSWTGGPASYVETLNFDLGTGQRIGFDDLFVDSTTALDILAGQALPMLQDQLGLDYDPTVTVGGTNPSPANYLNWALTSEGMKITFASHQVTPRGDLLPTVVVPWHFLKPVMVETGPVAALAGF
jgi:hypothetical protein